MKKTRHLVAITVLALLMITAAGCGEDEVGPESIPEEARSAILDELDKKGIAEDEIDWQLTTSMVEFEEVVWGYVPVGLEGEAELNAFMVYQKGLEADDFRRFVPEIEELINNKYPDHEVKVAGREAKE